MMATVEAESGASISDDGNLTGEVDAFQGFCGLPTKLGFHQDVSKATLERRHL